MKNILTTIKTGYIVILGFLYMTIWSIANADSNAISGRLINPVGNTANSIPEFISKILSIAVQIGTPIAILFIVYSGFLFLIAQGNQTKLETAKNTLMWSLVGTFVLLGAEVFSIAIEGTVNQLK